MRDVAVGQRRHRRGGGVRRLQGRQRRLPAAPQAVRRRGQYRSRLTYLELTTDEETLALIKAGAVSQSLLNNLKINKKYILRQHNVHSLLVAVILFYISNPNLIRTYVL